MVRRPWLPDSELGSGEGSQEEDPRCPGTVGGGACTSRYAPFEQRSSSALGQAQRADDRRTARRAVAGRRCNAQHPDATAGRCGGAEEEGGRARRRSADVGSSTVVPATAALAHTDFSPVLRATAVLAARSPSI